MIMNRGLRHSLHPPLLVMLSQHGQRL
jgi:hypothetical protein